MSEIVWMQTVKAAVEGELRNRDARLSVFAGKKLPYANEIREYTENDTVANDRSHLVLYETDLLITETSDDGSWKPRVIVEAKYESITTHDAITYSQKAFTHRQVHPYLRYGILIGKRGSYLLPGRLFRHGTQFDFMLSWSDDSPTQIEMDVFLKVLLKEVKASRIMEELIFDNRKHGRGHFTVLHKESLLSKIAF